ncbi:MAG: hypothetical protein ACYCSO_06370 [Cuniculiplasma sp.]
MDMVEIKKGGKYRVISNSGKDEPMETDGEFVGYTILGEEGALVFKVSGKSTGLLRLIPVSNLIAIEFGEDEVVTNSKNSFTRDSVNYIS